MDKLKKYLMLLLVATLSLTFTACGGDDNDEPKLPDSSFLYGTWHCPYQRVGADHYRGITMTFSSDGSFNASITEKSYVLNGEYEVRGKWKYKKGKISITGKSYHNDSYFTEINTTLEISYDEYINKLIVEEPESRYLDFSGQYTKM